MLGRPMRGGLQNSRSNIWPVEGKVALDSFQEL